MIETNNTPKLLIVGAGLAGICLARRLHERGVAFEIIDSGKNVSSSVAAGIINPIVFRRMTKSWRIDAFLPECQVFYGRLSNEWGNKYLVDIPIRRAFAHQQETDLWLAKEKETSFLPYMKSLDESDEANSSVKNTFGTGKVLQSAFVQTKLFLDDAKTWLLREKLLTETVFEHEELDAQSGIYKGISYSAIIFCEGYQSIYNPWFSYLSLEATKGEILTVESNELPRDESLNRKCFILPIGGDKFKIGATYAWRTPDVDLTDEAKTELLEHARSLTEAKFQIINHEAGIRPTTLDRRPMMGSHPEFPKLKIFNGLGAKGYMTAPLLAQEFADYLIEGTPFDREMNITRCEKLRIQK